MINDKSCVLVTGGAGFIGSHLVEHLVSIGAKVTIIDNFSTGYIENIIVVQSLIKIVIGDLGDLLRLNRIDLSNFDYIFHIAANAFIPPSVENPIYDYYTNLNNTLMLLEALRRLANPPRLVFTSSAAVYGNPFSLPIRESDPTFPISPYGVSKLASERYVSVYCQIYNLRATSLRLFSVYGPRQRKQVIFDILDKLRKNPDHLEVYGDGSQIRDFVYVLDVIQAMMLAATVTPGKGEVYNVASGTTHSISDVIKTWCKIIDVNPKIIYSGNVRPGDADRWIVDITHLQNIGFKNNTVLETGQKAIRDWYDAKI